MKIFIRSLLILVLLVVAVLAFFTFTSYSDGTRAGTVVKLSKRGVLLKTWEGQLNMGGVTNTQGGNSVSSLWEFSVDSKEEEVLKKLHECELSGQRVSLAYREKYFKLPWQGETKYYIYKVETTPQK
ncbi:MAG: hypothetical protein H7Y04_02475 [Verrucomicrobia bacterium]|nr:hypothetical protein [Cytophagales bacterium]